MGRVRKNRVLVRTDESTPFAVPLCDLARRADAVGWLDELTGD